MSNFLRHTYVRAIFLIAILTSVSDSFSQSNYEKDSIFLISLCDSAIYSAIPSEIRLELVSKAYDVASNIDCKLCIAEAYYAKAIVYYELFKIDSALTYFDKSKIIFQKFSEVDRLLNVYEYIAYCYLGDYKYDECIIHSNFGLVFSDSLLRDENSANFYLLLGYSYNEIGSNEKSTTCLINALKLFEKLDDSSGISSALISLGTVFSVDNNYDKALEYTFRALEISKAMDDKSGISACLNNIGDIYSSQNRQEQALDYFIQSLEIDKDLEDNNGIVIGLNNIGDTYRELKDTVLAISYYIKALDVGESNDYPVISIIYSNLGEIYLGKGSLDKALSNAFEGLKRAEEIGEQEQILNCYDLLRNIYFAKSEYKHAYNYYMKFNNLNDSIYSINKSKQIHEITSKYNDEKQKTEITQLKQQHTSESLINDYLIIVILVISVLIVALFVVNYIIRRSRKQVRRQKRYYDKLLEFSEDFIFVIGSNGLTKYISPSYERRIGRKISDRVGKNAFEFIHPDEIEFVRNEFKSLIDDSRPRNVVFSMMKANNDWITVYAFGQNLLDDPTIKGIVVNFWDISQLKHNEELIKKSETKFREIFNAFPDIYFQADIKGVITEISPSVLKITGYSRDELLGISSYEYSHFIDDWKKIAGRFATTGKINDHDTRVKCKDGKIIYCSYSAELEYDDNGVAIGIKGVIRDINSRIKNQKKLHDSQLRLREANSAKKKIFSIIAHDLIGPIGTNKSIVDLIVGQVDDLSHEEVITLISSLKPSLDSTYSLIENLLSWARIQQNKLVPNYEDVNISSMLSLIVELLNGQASRKSIRLKIKGDKNINVFADRNQMDIVFRNILSNAIKFSSKESIVNIEVAVKNNRAVVDVIDTGLGINQKQVSSIIQGKGSDDLKRGTDNEKGTGFGLVIITEFIKNNGGTLNIKSKEGEGTTFSVYLPLS